MDVLTLIVLEALLRDFCPACGWEHCSQCAAVGFEDLHAQASTVIRKTRTDDQAIA